jgi:glycosyltransferase involved in cell wall biosynthesis
MGNKPVVLVNHLLEPPGKITGITRYLFSILEQLASNNSFHYVLVTTWSRDQLPEKLRVTSVTCLTRRFIESTPLNIATQMAVIPRLKRETRAVLEFNCNPIGCFWPFWPRIITVHDLYFDLMPKSFPKRHRMWWHLLFPRSLDAASKVICVSEATRNHLTRFYPRSAGKAVVVHEAGAANDESLKTVVKADLVIPPREKPYALYVGNLSSNKNPAVLVEALQLLDQQGISIPIYHVGRDELALLSEAQARVRVQTPVRSIGLVSDAVLAAIYREAHCLVNTSLDEGFCLPILEAQSRRVPVVCSDIPVLREIAGDGALFFNPVDPAALARSLSMIFADRPLRESMANRALQNAAHFSWKRAARETEAVFRDALDRKGVDAK